MKCPECQRENPDAAHFCLGCGIPLSLRCPSCETELPVDARFCMSCGQPVAVSTPVDEARLGRLAAVTPDTLVQKVRDAAHQAGERRMVTALFMDVVGSTAMTERMDAEEWTSIMNGAFDRFYPAIYRYEGTIARLLGDALLAFFGAPVAHEDDPIRAVHAALDLLVATREYAVEVQQKHGVRFEVRVGLNTGWVIVGKVGSDLRYEYTPMGGVVNLAARMQAAARPMTALMTESTYRFVAPVFDAEDWGRIQVKGRAEPVHAYRVLAAKPQPGRLRGLVAAGLESPMVGRDAELANLTRLCEAVRAGLGRAVLVVGEPGLGKTRLIAEWRAAVQTHLDVAPPALWAEGHCLSYGQNLPYHLLLDLLRSLIGVQDGAGEAETRAALLTLTEELFGDEALGVYAYLGHLLLLNLEDEALEQVRLLDPQSLQAQYLAALRRLLQAITTRRPLILVLEDIHWADPSSTELLIKLLPLASAAPVLFCMVARPDRDVPGWRLVNAAREVLGGSLAEITLTNLAESDSQQLAANLLEFEALPETMRALILRRAEGNPFFVEEVIRMLIDRGAIVQRDGGWVAGSEIDRVEIPESLQALLMARIDRLPDDVKQTLRIAAVIGRQFPVKVLARVLEGGIDL